MKIILTTLNSKFIHSNLAIRYLQEYTKDLANVEIEEYTINQNIDFIVSELYDKKADMIGFSTYIWNLSETLEICESLKIINPNLKILLGGPEVSFDGEDLMSKKPFVDYIIYGEGEETFREFIEKTLEKENLEDIDGLIYREEDKIIKNKPRELMRDLDKIPSPYDDIGNSLENKIIYYESSRGCPFNCAFCLSSTIKGVRYFDIERVKKDLNNLIDGKVGQVKFVDRTFNANKKYAMEIMNFIMDKNPENMNFHFEVTAHLLDEEMLEFLSNVKEGLFQFEIGVQSTNEKTIESIGRVTDFKKLSKVVTRIESYKTIHQHLDLIAGLPYEDYGSFRTSFNDVYALRPEKLQLGFLKLLKGSKLRSEEDKYGFKYLDKPPYEVLSNDFMTYEDIQRLKGIEDIVEKYYNEEYFKKTLEFILNYYDSPFDFYEEFADYWKSEEYHLVSHSRNRLYEILREFSKKKVELPMVVDNLIKYDFISNHNRTRVPNSLRLGRENDKKFNIHDILKDERVLSSHLKEYEDLPTRSFLNKVSVEYFDIDILKLIDMDYKIQEFDEIYRETFILFKHRDGEIKRSFSYDITEIVEELM